MTSACCVVRFRPPRLMARSVYRSAHAPSHARHVASLRLSHRLCEFFMIKHKIILYFRLAKLASIRTGAATWYMECNACKLCPPCYALNVDIRSVISTHSPHISLTSPPPRFPLRSCSIGFCDLRALPRFGFPDFVPLHSTFRSAHVQCLWSRI